MRDLWIIVFGTVAGFTFAGLVTTGHDIVSGRKLRFAFDEGGSPPALLGGILLRLIAGPYLLCLKAYDLLTEPDANLAAIAAFVAVACMWGCLSGMVVIDLFGGFTPTAAAAR